MCVLLLKYFFICAAAAEPKRSSLDSQTIESDQVIVTFFNSLHCFDITRENFQPNPQNSSISALQQHLILIAGLRWLRLLIT